MRYSLYLILFFLSACSGVTTPDSHYYRLSTADTTNEKYKIDKIYRLAKFKAEGMLNANNLLYVEKNRPNELKQFHYHQWQASLSSIVTENFIAFFKKTTSTNIIVHDYSVFDGYLILPVIKTMEIQYSNSAVNLVMNIEFKVKKGSKFFLSRTYHSKKTYQTRDIYQLVSNYNEVLQDIYAQFIADISLL